MPTVINEIKYLTASELLKELGVTRQTLWRWRQEGKIPAGHRYRGRHVLFSTEEAEAIKEFANRIEPIDGSPDEQLSLFKGNHQTKRGGVVNMTDTKKAVVLLSGGLDSSTTLAIAMSEGYVPYALSFRYGQRHQVELDAASRIAELMGVAQHVVADIDLRLFGGSALTDDINVPKERAIEEMSVGIPVTYVPARNTIFLSFALAWAEVLEACNIFIGVNAVDYSGYPDCRPEYIKAYERMAILATKAGVECAKKLKIHTPLIDLTKAEIIQKGTELDVDYRYTSSCYDPSPEGAPCGMCDSCQLRQKGFTEAGLSDPLLERFKQAVA